MTVKINENDNDSSDQSDGDSLSVWYHNLKRENEVTANTWLANMKMVYRVYGKSPGKIAQMTPEEAYNFVLNMVKEMQNDGRSFSYIDTMIKAIDDWLEFKNPKTSRKIKLSIEDLRPAQVNSTNSIGQMELIENSLAPSAEIIYGKDQLRLLKEKSESLLRSSGAAFVNQLRDLESILADFDPAPDSVVQSIDKMVNNGVQMDLGAYYFAAYSATRDLDKALNVYRMINSLMRYIALMDGFYETGDKDRLKRANRLLDEVMASSLGQSRLSIKLSVEKIWPYWMLEKIMRQRMLDGYSFSDKELRYFALFKSTDSPLLYCTVLDNVLETFSPNVAMVFHYNQCLIDILDDYYDIEEDLQTQMPNTFMMASSGHFLFSPARPDLENIRPIITGKDTRQRVIILVDWVTARLKEIVLPPEYAFLRHITDDHTYRLRNIIS